LGRQYDLQTYGIEVLRFTNVEIDKDLAGVIEKILSHAKKRMMEFSLN